jgi:glycosyltransferase involved in cell wall biosynthesis
MRKVRGSGHGISKLSAGFYSAAKAAEFARFARGKDTSGILRLYAAGNLGGQKCISVAFQALALAKQRGVGFRYHLGSGGPEVAHLKVLAKKLNLTDEIVFGQSMARAAYQEELGRTHIYLLPSMRETVGLTMLEAMLAGCVPIVADNGGPRVTVTDECGYKIAVTTHARMAEEIANVVERIDRDRQVILDKGRKASERVMELHTEENYLRSVGGVYRSLVEKRARGD